MLPVERRSQCSRGDKCSFRHESNDHAQKPTPKAATPSEPSVSRGRSVSRKRNIQGKCNPGVILRQPCRYCLKETCTRTLREYWHPPECQFYKTETGCKAGDKCLFPHHKVDEQPNKKPKKGFHSHKGRASDDKNAVAVVKSVPQLGCVSQDSESLDCQTGRQSRGTRCKKSWDRFEEYGSLSLRYVMQVSGKQRTIAWKDTSQKSTSAKYLRHEI